MLGQSSEQLAPIIIGVIAAFATTVVGKWMDARSDDRRRDEEGRRISDHDIRTENNELRNQLDELREAFLKCREDRMLGNMRCREYKKLLSQNSVKYVDPFPEIED